jgi:hypothetical protein
MWHNSARRLDSDPLLDTAANAAFKYRRVLTTYAIDLSVLIRTC